MSYEEDMNTLHNFLLQTSEGNLKRMLVDGQMTEAHLRLLLKIAKGAGHAEFKGCYEREDFPKIKMSASENDIKEGFWAIAKATLQSRGLIGAAPPAAQAA
jgi:hypothetical protein